MAAAVTESGRQQWRGAAVIESGRRRWRRPLQKAGGRYKRPLQEAGGGRDGGRYINGALRQDASTAAVSFQK
jgi:hypothetical protein